MASRSIPGIRIERRGSERVSGWLSCAPFGSNRFLRRRRILAADQGIPARNFSSWPLANLRGHTVLGLWNGACVACQIEEKPTRQ